MRQQSRPVMGINFDTLIKVYDWNDDLGTVNSRQRGYYRAIAGLIVFAVGAPIFILGVSTGIIGIGMVGAFIGFFGFSALPCAAAEILQNRSWSQTRRPFRLLFLLLGMILFILLFLLILLTSLVIVA